MSKRANRIQTVTPQPLAELADELAVLQQAHVDGYQIAEEALTVAAKLLERNRLMTKDTMAQFGEETRDHTGEPLSEVAMLFKAISGRLPIEQEAKILNRWAEYFGDRWAEIQFTIADLAHYGEIETEVEE